ncbi:MAG: hypothetical protein D6683_13120 [Actinomyces sp.]|nr:MAG: hypothetical protein D6683_13120 [Actinomyces sp.]
MTATAAPARAETGPGPGGRSAPAAPADPAPLERLLGWCTALVGVGIGGGVLADNSFLTHLATGRVILDSGVPHHDVFAWTSRGAPVVVQSWLASALYAGVEELAGLGGLRTLFAATVGLLAWLLWRSTAGAGLPGRVVAVALVCAIGSRYWTERPLLLGLVALTLVVIVERRDEGGVGVLALVGALWIKVHGSWPLGVVWLAAAAVGAAVDTREAEGRWSLSAPVERRLRGLGALAAGVVVGGLVDPYAGRLLVFPLALLGRGEILARVAEWRAPTFTSTPERLFLVLAAAGVVALVRRPRWREGLPVLVLVGAALMSRRNIPVACVGLAPLVARGLPLPAGLPLGSSRLVGRAATVVAVAAVILALVGPRPPHLALDAYPVEAVDALETAGLVPGDTVRLAHTDRVGNYLEFRFGPTAPAFVDDRYELHSAELMDDYLSLVDADPRWETVLGRWGIDALLWEDDTALVALARSAGWRELYRDERWVVLCRPDDPICP